MFNLKIQKNTPELVTSPSFFTRLVEGSISRSEQVQFAKRLAFLMRAGVPILESLQILAGQSKTKGGKKMLENLVSEVSNGHFLSTAMAKFSSVFGDFAVNIVKVGEQAGILPENLNYLAEELKKKQALRKKVMGALFYPIFIVVATLLLVGLLTVVVFPKVLPIFTSINVPLPVSTKILMSVSRFLIAYGFWVLILILIFPFALLFLSRLPKVKAWLDKVLLKIPLAGSIAQNYYLANFCRTMGLLLKGESRLDEALQTSARTTQNMVYRKQLENLAQTVAKGSRMSEYMLKNKKYFPDMVSHMLAVGETAGNLSESFMYLADMYETEVDDQTKNLSTLIEPVLMVFMGLLVGFVAISIITPIYSVTQKLHP